MAVRPITIFAFVTGAAVALGASTLQRLVGTMAAAAITQRETKPTGPAAKPAVVAMDDEQIGLAQIEQQTSDQRPSRTRASAVGLNGRPRRTYLAGPRAGPGQSLASGGTVLSARQG